MLGILLALSDRIAVMFGGRIVHETPTATADIAVIGPGMAGSPRRRARPTARPRNP